MCLVIDSQSIGNRDVDLHIAVFDADAGIVALQCANLCLDGCKDLRFRRGIGWDHVELGAEPVDSRLARFDPRARASIRREVGIA